tara:strand:- start:559 stop:807 length:249 start_codon:yes stop_codon:yes gene_type:complete
VNGILNSLRVKEHAWTMFSGIKQNWLRVYMMYTRNWMANLLQLGLFSVKVEISKLPTYSGILVKLKNFLQKFLKTTGKTVKR